MSLLADILIGLVELLVLGLVSAVRILRRVTDGPKEERQTSAYAVPEMRRLRWLARTVVCGYIIIGVTAPMLLAGSSIDAPAFVREHRITTTMIYLGSLWAGLEGLALVFGRRRRAIAARLAESRAK